MHRYRAVNCVQCPDEFRASVLLPELLTDNAMVRMIFPDQFAHQRLSVTVRLCDGCCVVLDLDIETVSCVIAFDDFSALLRQFDDEFTKVV